MALISLGGRLMSSTNWPSCASADFLLRSLMLIVNDCSCSDLICVTRKTRSDTLDARSLPPASARLGANFAKVGLEATEQALHFAEDAVAPADLLLQRH
jgi:hypothetical protein